MVLSRLIQTSSKGRPVFLTNYGDRPRNGTLAKVCQTIPSLEYYNNSVIVHYLYYINIILCITQPTRRAVCFNNVIDRWRPTPTGGVYSIS